MWTGTYVGTAAFGRPPREARRVERTLLSAAFDFGLGRDKRTVPYDYGWSSLSAITSNDTVFRSPSPTFIALPCPS